MRDTIQKAHQLRNYMYGRRSLLYKKLANFIPRSEAAAGTHQSPHERIDHKPSHKNDYEADGDVDEYLFRTGYLIARDTREVEPSRPREEHCGEEYGDIDARIEDILCDSRKGAHGLASSDSVAFLRHYLSGKGVGRKRERRCDEEDDSEEHGYTYGHPVYHKNIVAWGKIRHTVHCCVGGRVVKCTWL